MDPADSLSGLHGQAGNTGNAIAFLGSDHLDVGRNTGPGGGVEPGDGQYDRGCGRHLVTVNQRGAAGELQASGLPSRAKTKAGSALPSGALATLCTSQ